MLRRDQGADRPAWLDAIKLLEPEDIADGVVQLITDDTLAGRALRIMAGRRELADLPAIPGLRPAM
jgi:hypothetical protein